MSGRALPIAIGTRLILDLKSIRIKILLINKPNENEKNLSVN
jgi:hypothetical protein